MPQRDPKLRKYRVAVYIAYGLIVAWIVVPFVLGGGRGVYTREGLDRLDAVRAATALCDAVRASAPAVRVAGCPEEGAPGNPEALIAQAKSHAEGVSDAGMKDRLRRAVASTEMLVRGVKDPQLPQRIADALGDFLH
jgi:hypothetical protein